MWTGICAFELIDRFKELLQVFVYYTTLGSGLPLLFMDFFHWCIHYIDPSQFARSSHPMTVAKVTMGMQSCPCGCIFAFYFIICLQVQITHSITPMLCMLAGNWLFSLRHMTLVLTSYNPKLCLVSCIQGQAFPHSYYENCAALVSFFFLSF